MFKPISHITGETEGIYGPCARTGPVGTTFNSRLKPVDGKSGAVAISSFIHDTRETLSEIMTFLLQRKTVLVLTALGAISLLQATRASFGRDCAMPQSLLDGGPGDAGSPAGQPTNIAPVMAGNILEGECSTCGSMFHGLFDNVSFFGGLDGSKQPQDFGVNAEFGGRASVNWGIPLVESIGLAPNWAPHSTRPATRSRSCRAHSAKRDGRRVIRPWACSTRLESGFNWGFVYDFMHENYYDSFSLGQWRIDLSYQVTQNTSFGIWSAISSQSESGHYTTIPVTLTPITQANLYWSQTWNGGVQTMIWGGWADGHGQVNVVLGDLPRIENPFVFGTDPSCRSRTSGRFSAKAISSRPPRRAR